MNNKEMRTFKEDIKQPNTQYEESHKLIQNHPIDCCYLDLSGRYLHFVPPDLLKLVQIQDLYLEGNHIKTLPDNFFDRLPALKWLDLRNNQLKCIPSSIGRHRSIKHLLLEGNKLTHLPLQMGLTKSLKGLNLRNNPLQVPPLHIVHQGVYVILSYLYQELQKSQKEKYNEVTSSIQKLNVKTPEPEVLLKDNLLFEEINLSCRKNISSPKLDDYDIMKVGATPLLASLHKPLTLKTYKTKFQPSVKTDITRNSEDNQNKLQRLRLPKSTEKNNKQHLKKLSGLDDKKSLREKRTPLSSIKTMKDCSSFASDYTLIQLHNEEVHEEKVEFVNSNIQRTTRNKTIELSKSMDLKCPEIHNFRQEIFNKTEGTDLDESIKPFKEKLLRPNSVNLKNVDIQQRIKIHSSHMHERLKKQKSSDCEIKKPQTSKEIQRQLLNNKIAKDAQMEYRFRAFTGDSVSVQSSSNKTGSL